MRERKANSGLNSAWKLVGATLVALSVAAAVFVCIPQRHAASDELPLSPVLVGGGVIDGSVPSQLPRINAPTTSEPPATASKYRENFMVVTEAKNWYNARQYCRSLGMELAAVRNAEENSWVVDLMKSSGVSQAWVGIFMDKWDKWADAEHWKLDGYKWADASKMTNYRNWAAQYMGSGFNDFEDECGAIVADADAHGDLVHVDGEWNTVPLCDILLPFVCYEFDAPFVVYSGLGEKTWQEANDYCQQTHGSELATVRQAADNDWISAEFTAIQPTNHNEIHRQAWIGLSDGASQSDWQWTDGSKMTYTNWVQPNYPLSLLYSGGNCVELEYVYGSWKDCDCNLQLQAFVCNAH